MRRSMTRFLVLLALLAPVFVESGQMQAPPQAALKNALPIQPKITGVNLEYYNGGFIALDVVGVGLGYSPGKFLYIDGIKADQGEVVTWTNTNLHVDEEVFFEITVDIVWWDHIYQWSIRNGNTLISNVYSKRFPLHFESVNPSSAKPGAIFEIIGDGLTHAGVLKIGETTVTDILSKQVNKIRARVPPMAPGTYAVSIRQGTTTISETKNITVH